MLVTALCEGERVDAARVRQSDDAKGPVVWEIQRDGTDELRQVTLGAVPPGFRMTVGTEASIPRVGWAEVSLSGGGAARSGSRYDAGSLAELSQAKLDELAGRAKDNCDQVPFRSPWWLAIAGAVMAVALLVFVIHWAGRALRRPSPRAALVSPWSYLSVAFGLMVALVLIPGSYGQRSAPATYLLYGAVLSLVALVFGLVGRLARRIRIIEWLLVLPALIFVLVAGLLATVVGGMFGSCGAEWTLDCSTSLTDRLLVLALLLPGWIAAVWVGEGGWWPRLLPAFERRQLPGDDAHPPVGAASEEARASLQSEEP